MARALRAAPPASLRFVRAYVVTMRPYLLFVSGIAGLTGVALVPGVSAWFALCVGAAFFLSYGFGQALTDCFQLDTDALSAPYRPLVRGEIRRRPTLVVSLVGLTLAGGVLIAFSPWNAPLAALAVLGLATYTPFKRRWWAGPFYNAVIVALLPVMGFLAARGSPPVRGSSAEGALAAHGLWAGAGQGTPWLILAGAVAVTFFAYANFVLVGYFKDVSADRATGYRTLPVVFGLSPSSLVSDGFALLAVLGAWWVTGACQGVREVFQAGLDLSAGSVGHAAWLGLLALGSLVAIVAQIRTHRVRSDSEAYRAIEPVLYAHVLLLAAIAARFRPGWSPVLIAFCVAFWMALRARTERSQI